MCKNEDLIVVGVLDINECISSNIECGPEKMCFNKRGDVDCIDIPCPENYTRDPLTK